jgi:hypothetical protein
VLVPQQLLYQHQLPLSGISAFPASSECRKGKKKGHPQPYRAFAFFHCRKSRLQFAIIRSDRAETRDLTRKNTVGLGFCLPRLGREESLLGLIYAGDAPAIRGASARAVSPPHLCYSIAIGSSSFLLISILFSRLKRHGKRGTESLYIAFKNASLLEIHLENALTKSRC